MQYCLCIRKIINKIQQFKIKNVNNFLYPFCYLLKIILYLTIKCVNINISKIEYIFLFFTPEQFIKIYLCTKIIVQQTFG